MATINEIPALSQDQANADDRRRRGRVAYTNAALLELLRHKPGDCTSEAAVTSRPPEPSLLPVIAASLIVWTVIAANLRLLLHHLAQ